MAEFDCVKMRNQLRAETVIKELKGRNMTGYYADSREEALRMALEIIPKGASVSWGGTISIEQIGLKDALRKGGYKLYAVDDIKDPEERRRAETLAFNADYFLTSCNAVSEDGILVNIDGRSNRVSSIAYGPKHVLMIVGMNKIARDLDAALSRAKNEAAPLNAVRLSADTPCAKTGVCFDCKAPGTICCQYLVTRYSRQTGRMILILVNDYLGL